MARTGALRPTDLVWRIGTPQWVSVGSVPGILETPPGRGTASGAVEVAAPRTPVHGIAVWLFACWAVSMSLVLVSARLGGEIGLAATSLNWLLAIGSAVWAGIDSARLGIRRYQSFVAQHPAMVGVVVALFWAVAFPWYLADRERLKAGALPAAQSPKPSTRSTITRVTIFISLFVAYLLITSLLLAVFVGSPRP